MKTATQNKIIFFSPYAGIWAHAFPEALVAAEIKRANNEIIYVTCDGIFSAGCVVMSAHGVNDQANKIEREEICFKCRYQRDLLLEHLNVKEVRMESLLDEHAHVAIDAAVLSITPQAVLKFEFDNLPLAKYALHETIIRYKLSDKSELTPAVFAYFKHCFSHVLMAAYVAKELLKIYSPSQIVLYNSHISTNFALMNVAEQLGVPVYGLHANAHMVNRLSTLLVFRKDMAKLYRQMNDLFNSSLARLPADKTGIENAGSHFVGLASGKSIFVYSTPKHTSAFNVREFFGIRRDQKILLATLSSYDELYSSQMLGVMSSSPMMFSDQVEWVGELIAWAETRPDVFLLIRVHPREFPNRRDPVHSIHARKLAAAFEKLPSNVRINWPTDNVSLYDLATEVAVGLNAWSTAGKELAQLGIPVVLFVEEIIYYPVSLNILAKSRQDYFDCIDAALDSGWSYQRMRQVFRWNAIEFTLSSVSIIDGFRREEGGGRRPFIRRLIGRVRRMIDPLYVERAEIAALHRPLALGKIFVQAIVEDVPVVTMQAEEREILTESAEKLAIQKEIQRILREVYHNNHTGSRLITKLQAFAVNGDEASTELFT